MDELRKRFDEGIRSLPYSAPTDVRERSRHRLQAEVAAAAAVVLALTAVAVGVSNAQGGNSSQPATATNSATTNLTFADGTPCRPTAEYGFKSSAVPDPTPATLALTS